MIILVVLLELACIVTWVSNFPINTKTGIVVEVEQSAWFGGITTIRFAAFSRNYESLTVNGLHEFKIGHIYKFTYQKQGRKLCYHLIEYEDLGPSSFYTEKRSTQ